MKTARFGPYAQEHTILKTADRLFILPGSFFSTTHLSFVEIQHETLKTKPKRKFFCVDEQLMSQGVNEI